ncbi:MAG: hypothetical protein ACTHME_05030 [Candidatus Nitrosocosmicus sp.]
MALNPNYVPLTPLWEVFTDKDALTFLADGYVKFFVDTARTVGKPVYQLTGSPPNYDYIEYGFLDTDGSWRVNMNLQGAFDQVIYGYPLDENGEVQLYFAQFYNADGVFQFSREGFPNFFIEGGSVTNPVNINYIPDGQFRLHTDIPSTALLETGQVRDAVTNIAYGGWTFERPSGSTARDFVTFQRIGSYVTNPQKSPRYAVEIQCQSPNAGDTYKDLRVKFDDVNKFASDSVTFTFGITAKTVSISSVNVELLIIKNFGTGGDPQTETSLTTFTFTNTYTPYYFSFVFGDNTGKVIGALNDDYAQIAIRFPVNDLFDVELTDALLTPGTVVAPTFNDTTTREFLYESLFDDMDCPPADGGSIGLPLVLTKTGLQFDASTVGMISLSSTYAAPFGFLPCEGSRYDSTLHSTDGIPYSRLGNVLNTIVSSPLPFTVPIFGTGSDFVTAYIDNTLYITLSTNSAGSTASASDGLAPTGFTFSTNHVGATYEATGFIGQNRLYIISNNPGVVGDPSIGTVAGSVTLDINGPNSRSVTQIIITSALAGQYFLVRTPSVAYYIWYKVDGVGTDPAISGATGIEVDINAGISAQDLMRVTALAMSGSQVSQITTTVASTIPQSAYFNFSTISQSYYVWYNKDGGGVDPALTGKIGIEVDISSTDTKDQVTSKTVTAINTRYFATPDLRGLSIKGYSGISGFDLGDQLRYASNSVIYGNAIGTREFSANISHNHKYLAEKKTLSTSSGDTDITAYDASNPPTNDYINVPTVTLPETETRPLIDYDGYSESRPENIYLNYFIKY